MVLLSPTEQTVALQSKLGQPFYRDKVVVLKGSLLVRSLDRDQPSWRQSEAETWGCCTCDITERRRPAACGRRPCPGGLPFSGPQGHRPRVRRPAERLARVGHPQLEPGRPHLRPRADAGSSGPGPALVRAPIAGKHTHTSLTARSPRAPMCRTSSRNAPRWPSARQF